MVIDVKPAMTLAEAADQMEQAMSMCVDHYARVCDMVLSRWSVVCRSVDIDALLALAEDVDGAADDSGGFEPLAGMLRDIARRIREACGEEAKDEA